MPDAHKKPSVLDRAMPFLWYTFAMLATQFILKHEERLRSQQAEIIVQKREIEELRALLQERDVRGK